MSLPRWRGIWGSSLLLVMASSVDSGTCSWTIEGFALSALMLPLFASVSFACVCYGIIMANCRIDLFHVFWTRIPYGVEYHGNDFTGLHDEIYSLRLAWWRLLGLRGLNPWKWGADGSPPSNRDPLGPVSTSRESCNSPCKWCNHVGFPTSNEMHSLTARRTGSMAYLILASLDRFQQTSVPP